MESSVNRVLYFSLLAVVLSFLVWSYNYTSPVARILDEAERLLDPVDNHLLFSI